MMYVLYAIFLLSLQSGIYVICLHTKNSNIRHTTLQSKLSMAVSLPQSSSTTSTNIQPTPSPTTTSANAPQIFVCTNKWCREKGSDSTMATFTFLTPQSIPVVGVNCLNRCNKGPNARILTSNGAFVEASMIRSVENAVDLLQKHLGLNVNVTSAEVLRLNYEGNIHLRNGEVDLAIECYDKGLELGDTEQEGVLLVMRGTAFLQRAYACKMRHRDIILLSEEVLPTIDGVRNILNALSSLETSLKLKASMDVLLKVDAIYKRLDKSPNWNESKWPEVREGKIVTSGEELLNRCIFSWSLYEHALMRALQDLLTATVVLPGFSQAWRRAADTLAELRLYPSAIEYYEVAVR